MKTRSHCKDNLVGPSWSTTTGTVDVLWAAHTAIPRWQTHLGAQISGHHRNSEENWLFQPTWLHSQDLSDHLPIHCSISILLPCWSFFSTQLHKNTPFWSDHQMRDREWLSWLWNIHGNSQSKGPAFVLRLGFRQCFPFWKVWGAEMVPYNTLWVFHTFQQ